MKKAVITGLLMLHRRVLINDAHDTEPVEQKTLVSLPGIYHENLSPTVQMIYHRLM